MSTEAEPLILENAPETKQEFKKTLEDLPAKSKPAEAPKKPGIKLHHQKIVHKFKDKPTKRQIVISNKAEPFMVVKEIVIRKVAGANNKMEVHLIMPQPEDVEVVMKKK